MKKKLCIILSVLLLVALLNGCGGSIPDSNASSGSSAAYSKSESTAVGGYGSGWAMDEAAESYMEAPTAAEPQSGGKSTGSNLPANVKLIYRANIDMESTEFDAALQGLNELTERLGGYYETSELNNYSSYRHGYYTVRLPSENFEAFCSAVGDLAQVNSLSRSAEDVSEYYYDLESRLATQQTKLARLQELLKQAEDMEDIITLESAISDTELTIENLTGSLRKYDSRVGYATIHINLNEVYKLTEVEEPVIGFGAKLGQAFRSGATGFVNGLQRFLLGLARGWIGWLIFIVLVVAVILIVRKIKRRRDARYAEYARQARTQQPYAVQAPPAAQETQDAQEPPKE